MIPFSELGGDRERSQFIKELKKKSGGLPIRFPFPQLHSHYVFDLLAGGYGRFQRSLEETKRMKDRSSRKVTADGYTTTRVDERKFKEEKREHGRQNQSGTFDSIKLALGDLYREIKSARDYDDSFRERVSSLRDRDNELGRSINQDQYQELKSLFDSTFQAIKKLREEVENSNKRKLDPIINAAINLVAHSQDVKTARQQLVAATQSMKGVRLSKEDRDKFRSRIDDAFKELERKEGKQKGDIEGKQYAEYVKMKDLVEKLVPTVGYVTDLRGFKQSLREVQEQVRNANLGYKDRESLMKRINAAYEIINQRIDKQRREDEQHADVAYRGLVSQIDNLVSNAHSTTDYGGLRNELSQARNGVFAVKGLKREQRDALIKKINSAYDTLKTRQTADKAQRDREYKERKDLQRQQNEQRQREFQERKAQQQREYQERQQRQKEERERKNREFQERKAQQAREKAERERKAKENRERNKKSNNKRR